MWHNAFTDGEETSSHRDVVLLSNAQNNINGIFEAHWSINENRKYRETTANKKKKTVTISKIHNEELRQFNTHKIYWNR